MRLRPMVEDDYGAVIAVVDAWWGGRPMAAMLPRLFARHFGATSLVAEDADGTLRGFLVGLRSPAQPAEGYVHFVGVDPGVRGRGVGTALHEAFAASARAAGCDHVRCVTAPTNTASVAFHRRLGFRPEPGPAELDGVPYVRDYDGPGQDRVVLVRRL